MKTKYMASAAISPFINSKNELSLAIYDFSKVTKAAELWDLIENTALRNGLGGATIQLIPITKKQYKDRISFILEDSLKRVNDE